MDATAVIWFEKSIKAAQQYMQVCYVCLFILLSGYFKGFGFNSGM
jgi:hypothetical protein